MSVIEEAGEVLNLIDLINPESPLSEELSPEGIEFLRSLSKEVLDSLERLRPGALASRERILNDVSRKV